MRAVKRLLFVALFCILTMAPMAGISAQAEAAVEAVSGTGIVKTKSSLNIRSGPGQDYDKIGVLKDGEEVSITGLSDNGWYQITVGDDTGYIYSDYVDADISAQDPASDDEEELEKEYGEPEEGYRGLHLSPRVFRTTIAVVAIVVILILMVVTLRRIFSENDDEAEPDYPDEDPGDDYYEEDPSGREYYEEDYEGEDPDGEYYEGPYEGEDPDGEYYEGPYEGEDPDGEYYEGPYEGEDPDGEYYEDAYEGEDPDGGYYEDEGPGDRGSEGDRSEYYGGEYPIKIDSKYFDDKDPIEQPEAVTGYLEKKKIREALGDPFLEEEPEDDGLSKDAGGAPADQEIILKKLDELQEEIKRLKKE